MSPGGQGLPSNSLPFLYSDFHGGLNTQGAPFLLTDDEARDLSNVQGTLSGAIVKRLGLQTLATPAVTLTSLFPLESTATSYLIGAGGTSLYSITNGGVVTSIASGLTSNKRWEFASAPVAGGQGPLYGMNGTDTPKQWTGTGSAANWTNATGSTPVPNGTMCTYHQNQVFVAGVGANPSRLFWSAIANPTNWDPASLTGAGFMDFDPNDGEAITGIGKVGASLLVCKPRKLFILIDPATATSRRLTDTIGCVAHRSIAPSANGTYFLAEDRGVYLTNGSKLTPISDKIQPTLDSISSAARQQAAGACYNAHYYLSLNTGSGSNDTTFDWDEKLSSWWKHSFGSNQFGVWHPSGIASLYSAKATAALVDHCFAPSVYQDNGTNFTWFWKGPWQSPTFYRRRRFPTPYFRKRLRQIRVDGSGTVDFSLAKDYSSETLLHTNILAPPTTDGLWGVDNGTFWGINDGSLWGGAPIIGKARMFAGFGVANAFSLVFSATSNTPDAVYEYVLMITDRRDLVVA